MSLRAGGEAISPLAKKFSNQVITVYLEIASSGFDAGASHHSSQRQER